MLAAYRHDTAELRRLLRRQIAAMGNPWRSAADQWFAGVFLGDTSLRDAIARLRRRAVRQDDRDFVALMQAFVALDTGRPQEAGWPSTPGQVCAAVLEAAARRFRYFFVYTTFLSTHYREARRLAELAGQREQAIDAYTRYLALRRDPEPALTPEVDKVRQALARLTGEGRN